MQIIYSQIYSIAIEQMNYMNKLYREYLETQGTLEEGDNPVLFGCITSASGRRNPNAPIMFVTTGIIALLETGNTGML